MIAGYGSIRTDVDYSKKRNTSYKRDYHLVHGKIKNIRTLRRRNYKDGQLLSARTREPKGTSISIVTATHQSQPDYLLKNTKECK